MEERPYGEESGKPSDCQYQHLRHERGLLGPSSSAHPPAKRNCMSKPKSDDTCSTEKLPSQPQHLEKC